MVPRDEVCVLIPTYNEAPTIGGIVTAFREDGFENVLVIDGHSTDDTMAIAREVGARVVEQSGRGQGSGKGQAVREAMGYIDTRYVLMIDGDGTYRPDEAERVLEPVVDGLADHAIGNRFANMDDDAMRRLNGIGNRIFNRTFRLVHGRNFQDILSGYRAFTRESFDRMHLTADGFGIETELSVECVKQALRVEVVPITYEARPDDSDTNLNPVRDGGAILIALYRLAKTNNPLFYFGSVGTALSILGLCVGGYVGVEWLTQRVGHEVLAVVAAFLLLFGVQLLIFGVLSDMIVSLHREQIGRVDELRTRIDDATTADAGAGSPPETDEASEADRGEVTARD
ncbi:TIGR04182 family glycosyltransferase [Halobacteriales archaeon SW_7_68_16]|nr:MAG: TIGR04182 family glycosyltransferase [Halobacteriales archaeon SW_7_68_16]